MNLRDHRTGPRHPGAGPARAVVLLATVLALSYLATHFTSRPGIPDTSDMPEVMAEGGCFNIEVMPVDHDPPVLLDEVERDVREQIDHQIEERGWEREPGDLKWARYGELASGGYMGYGHPSAGNLRWVLLFEPDDTGWFSSLFRRRSARGWNVIYVPESRQIGALCGGPVF